MPKGQTKAEIIVVGRGDWDGWLELRRHNVNHVAIENTARVVEVLSADVLAVVEAEDRIALQRFNDNYLVPRGVGFLYNMLIDGNDERGIDAGLYSKHPIRSIHSNIGLGLPGERTFSRDCAEFEIETPGRDTIWVLVNHFKSKGFGSASSSNARRERQAKAVAEIYRNRVAHNPKVAVVGDLNDTSETTPLAPLVQHTDLEDVMSHPLYLSGNDRRPGTYGSGAKSNKIDYILLSPALRARWVSAVGVERRGVWAPRTFPHFPEIGSAVKAASDHAAVWVDLRSNAHRHRSGRHQDRRHRHRRALAPRRWRARSDTTGRLPATLEAIAVLVRRLEAAVGRQDVPVGVGHPAPSRHPRLPQNSNSTCLNGRPFQQDLEAVLGHEVYLANDADRLACWRHGWRGGGRANVFAGDPRHGCRRWRRHRRGVAARTQCHRRRVGS